MQQACIERVRWLSAGRDGWVMTGASGQGKSTVIEALILASTVNPLLLHGELLSDRTDAILRLACRASPKERIWNATAYKIHQQELSRHTRDYR